MSRRPGRTGCEPQAGWLRPGQPIALPQLTDGTRQRPRPGICTQLRPAPSNVTLRRSAPPGSLRLPPTPPRTIENGTDHQGTRPLAGASGPTPTRASDRRRPGVPGHSAGALSPRLSASGRSACSARRDRVSNVSEIASLASVRGNRIVR
jgi:hypothetical protein